MIVPMEISAGWPLWTAEDNDEDSPSSLMFGGVVTFSSDFLFFFVGVENDIYGVECRIGFFFAHPCLGVNKDSGFVVFGSLQVRLNNVWYCKSNNRLA